MSDQDLETLENILGHLGACQIQRCAIKDQVIERHIDVAAALASDLLRRLWRKERGPFQPPGAPLSGDTLKEMLPPDFTRLVLEQWLIENNIDHHEGPWFAQSMSRMERAIDYALGARFPVSDP